MFFRKKSPKRLYYPAASKWYTRPRRRSAVSAPSPLREWKKKFFQWLSRSFHLALAIILLVLALGFLVLSTALSVKTIEVVRQNFNVDSAGIESTLSAFKGKSLFFLSKNQIYTAIQKKFPEFSTITIEKKFPSALVIHLESYPVIANLKAYYVLPKADEKVARPEFTALSKAIEELGADPTPLTAPPSSAETAPESAFDLAPPEEEKPIEQKCLLNRMGQAIFDQEENLELITVVLRGLTQPIEDREIVISQENMDYLLSAIQYFSAVLSIPVLSADYLPLARELHLKTPSGLMVWLTFEKDYKEQIDKLNTIYKAAELYKENLAYIDLRVRDKVIYCPRKTKCDN